MDFKNWKCFITQLQHTICCIVKIVGNIVCSETIFRIQCWSIVIHEATKTDAAMNNTSESSLSPLLGQCHFKYGHIDDDRCAYEL